MITNRPFYFMRHGQTDWNRDNILMGRSDIPLNDLGKQQATSALDIISKLNIKSIHASPLLRAKETAQIIYQGFDIVYDDNLMELGIGVMEGKHKGDGSMSDHDTIDGAEKWHDFGARITNGINKALSSQAPVLIVSHGGVYKKLSEILNLEYKSGLSNCDVVELTPYDNHSDIWSARVLHKDDL